MSPVRKYLLRVIAFVAGYWLLYGMIYLSFVWWEGR